MFVLPSWVNKTAENIVNSITDNSAASFNSSDVPDPRGSFNSSDVPDPSTSDDMLVNPALIPSSAGDVNVISPPDDPKTESENNAAADGNTGIGSDTDLSTPYNFAEFLSGLFSSVGAENEANRTFNASQAEANRSFQERMSNTAYLRAVRDLRAAGLNPILAFGSNSAASTPTGSAASYQTGGGDTVSSLLNSLANAASVLGDLLDKFWIKP